MKPHIGRIQSRRIFAHSKRTAFGNCAKARGPKRDMKCVVLKIKRAHSDRAASTLVYFIVGQFVRYSFMHWTAGSCQRDRCSSGAGSRRRHKTLNTRRYDTIGSQTFSIYMFFHMHSLIKFQTIQ